MSQQIEILEAEIAAKRTLLKELKTQEKKSRIFAETSVGKGCFKVLRTISKPFKLLNEYADVYIENPRLVVKEKFTMQAYKLLHKTYNLKREDKEASKYVAKMCKLVIKMEEIVGEDNDTISLLREEIDRLRTPPTEQEKELFDKITDIVDQEVNNHIHIDTVMDSK